MIELTTTEISRLAFRKLVLAGAKDVALELAEQLLNKDMITINPNIVGALIDSTLNWVINEDIQKYATYNPVQNNHFIVVSGFNKIIVEKEHYERIKKELKQ